MDDLISKQMILDEINKMPTVTDANGAKYIEKTCLRIRIGTLPSAQLERPKGKWIYGEHDIAMCDGYWCDQCGFFVPWDYKYKFIDFIKDYHWCPSCGADMRGEQA